MALQIWLPLNGNLENQGLCDTNITNSGATINESGKIGKCYSFNDSYLIGSNGCLSTATTEFSILFWVNYDDLESNTHCMYQQRTVTYKGISVWTVSNHICVGDGDYFWTSTYDLTPNVWTHIAVIRDSSSIKLYVNGILQDNSTTVGTLINVSTKFVVGCSFDNVDIASGSKQNQFYGKLNDLRVYDNCLSPKEIKDVSKGLVIHYPLDSPYEVGKINKINGIYSEGSFLYTWQFNKIKLENERGWNYTFNYTGTTDNIWGNLSSPHFTYTIGKTYYYSLKVRCNKWTSNKLYLRASRSDNDYATNMVVICDPSKADGKWHEYYTYITITGDTYDRQGTQVVCNPVLELYTGSLNSSGTVYTFDFDIKDIQVVESETYVPYVDNEFASNIVGDTSGYFNNGVLNGTLLTSNVSPRYMLSTVFDGNSSIDAPFKPSSTLPFTVSGWFYHISGTTYYACKNEYKTYICLEDKRYFIYKSDGQATVGNYTSTNNVWQHIVLVNDTTNSLLKLYVDAEYVGQVTTDGTVYVSDILNIGGRENNAQYNGMMSDFRIYTTALSLDDIKELYNTSAFITNNGTLCPYEIDEIDNGLDINSRGIVEAVEFYEEGVTDALSISGNGYTLHPPSNTNNYCSDGYYVLFNDVSVSKKYVVEIDFTWSENWASGTGGTFRIIFQGANKPVTGTSYIWSGTNYVTNAMNSYQSPLELVNNSPNGGTYHYKCNFIIPGNYGYDGCRIGMRCDYSDGNGTLSWNNLKIYEYEASLNNEKTKFGNNYITVKQFNEI